MTRHYPDLGSASDWSFRAEPIRSTAHIWVVTCHQYGISALVSQTSISRGNGLQRRSLRSKRFQSSYCAKVRAKQRLKGRGRGEEKEEEVPSFPSPSPIIHVFFALVPAFQMNLARKRLLRRLVASRKVGCFLSLLLALKSKSLNNKCQFHQLVQLGQNKNTSKTH